MALPLERASAPKETNRLPAVSGAHRERPKLGSSASRRPGTRSPSLRSAGRLDVIQVPGWQIPAKAGGRGLAWLVHGFSTRRGGGTTAYRPDLRPAAGDQNLDLNLGFNTTDDPAIVSTNREHFLEAVCGGAEKLSLATLKQIHSTLVRRVERGDEWFAPPVLEGDGLMTDHPGVLLGIQTADCLPVLVADKRNRAVAAFHAGWRGTLHRVVESGIGRMRLEFGSKPKDLVAAIGPGIGHCCYAVGEEVRHEFESQFSYASELFREVFDSDAVKQKYPMLFLTARAPGHSNLGPNLHLDLAEANRRQLLSAGLKPSAIYLAGECTACHTDRFFSHRQEQGFTGRMMSVIGIRTGRC